MKITVGVSNLTKARISGEFARKIAARVIASEAINLLNNEIEASIVFVSAKKIREINKKYRKIDCVTDVLSFAEDDISGKDGGPSTGSGQPNGCLRILGELLICIDQVKRDAKDLKTTFKKELEWVIIHGILHLFGYDHETGEAEAKKMRDREHKYLSTL
jgi:probable rRNA maturation factor